MFENLDDGNFLIFAAKAYEKPNCIMSEFQEDMKRFNYVKRLFQRYRRNKEIKERLVLNHLVVIYNVFGIEPSTRMLFYCLDEEDHAALKTFLLFLNYMPGRVKGIYGKDIISATIGVDMFVADKLRKIRNA